MTLTGIAMVEAEVRSALVTLRHPKPEFSIPTSAPGDGTPHLETAEDGYFWVVVERGKEHSRIQVDEDEAFFLSMEILTRQMAQGEELRTRRMFEATGIRRALGMAPKPALRDDYSRATWIEAHERLMGAIRTHWAERIAQKYREILRRYPLTPQERQHARRLDLSAFGLD